MTDRAKFEEMLERLIAEDRAGAEELFHEIVVEKSREIYSSILESEEEVEETTDEEVDESEEDDLEESEDEDLDESDDEDLDESDDEDLDEMFGLDEFETEADPMAAMGGDATDDMMGDLEMGDEEGEEGDEEEAEGPEEAMSDLKDALAALEAEFEKLMGGEGDEEGEDEEEPEEEAMAFEADDEDLDESDDDEVEESTDEEVEESVNKSAAEIMREYADKVAPAKMGDNGANAKSIVAGKNDMGGTASNIAAGGTEAGVEANKGQLKGNGVLKGAPKDMNTKNVNVPGAKGATKMASQPGHGAEKKGKPENAANKKSLIGGK